VIRTALGDIAAGTLGRTDYHEHLFQVSPLLPGDELDDEELSGREAAHLRAAGIDAMVEATPCGLGRDALAVARIAEATGLNIILTTGAHRREHYGDDHPLLDLDEAALGRLFRTELTEGIGDGPRAGLLKVGIGYWRIGPFERRVITGVAEAHRATGAPVMVHLEYGSAAFEVLEELAALGVLSHRVVLAHADRNPDPGLHAELCAAGAYLGYDGMARHRNWPDAAILDCLLRTAERGGADRLLLGGDVARRTRYRAYGGMPGLDYLPLRFVPRVEEAGGADLVRRVLIRNPARLLDWTKETAA
jgi:predicted metal-dependent phosphotriesterase family hydrolase